MNPDLLRRLLRAKDRMDASSEEYWPIERLAEVSCISKAHFARSFKQAFGTPPHRYLLTRRIERAQALLRDTGLSVTEIAFASGWASLGTFGRTFHDVTGDNPGTKRLHSKNTNGNLHLIPACVLKAAERPQLTRAVLEKPRRQPAAIKSKPLEEN